MKEARLQVPTKHGPVWVVAIADTEKQARRDARKAAEYVIRGIPRAGLSMIRPDGSRNQVQLVDKTNRRVWFLGEEDGFYWSEVRYG